MAGVGQEEAKWLLQFTNSVYNSEYGDGRPWGDGTAMAERAKVAGQNPWDAGCKVTPLLGGDAVMIAIREELEKAITIGKAKLGENAGPGTFGHVYFTGLQFNGLRDLSSTNPWGGNKWDPKITVEKDQTALGLVLRLMSAGIKVRMLLWMPNEVEDYELGNLAFEHRCMAAAVQAHNVTLQKTWNLQEPIGVVALDLRTATPLVSSLHQKMIAIRVGKGTANPVNVAYCGGVDLAFTRRDFGLAGTSSVGSGDWQSGTTIPNSTNGWPKQTTPPLGGYPTFPFMTPGSKEKVAPELDPRVYGTTSQHWHDHHLRLEGPVVATLEQQFVERWAMYAGGGVGEFRTANTSFAQYQVAVTSKACIAGKQKLVPLPAPEAVPALSGTTATVQMWRTIPKRFLPAQEPPFVRGEFTVMAGIAKAVLASTELITICDQYFWSLPLARLLAAQLKAQANLKLLIVLPPFGSTAGEVSSELGLREAALKTLYDELENAANRSRVMVRDVWSYGKGWGVYVHAKSQTYDDGLFVCGSANMNRRSLQCDAELDCAVLGEEAVQQHLCQLYACFTGSALSVSGSDFLGRFWTGIETQTVGQTLREDPFFAESVSGEPETPNGVKMPHLHPLAYGAYEPTSIKPKVDEEERDLAAITYLLEHCGENGTWPWREANEDMFPETEEEPEGGKPRMPRLVL